MSNTYMIKAFNARVRTEFKSYNFKVYRYNYYRVVEDVFQCFKLHRSVSGTGCTVEFDVYPLCRPEPIINKSTSGIYHLKNFERSYEWFTYDCNDIQTMQNCLNEIIRYMKMYLMPYFEKASTSLGAYNARIWFRENCVSAMNDNDPILLYWSLKLEKYTEGLKLLRSYKRHTESAFDINKHYREKSGDVLPDYYVERMEAKLRWIDETVNNILRGTTDIIQAELAQNEQQALRNLNIKSIE